MSNPKLSDTQVEVLTAAANRETGCVLPLPSRLKGISVTNVITALLAKDLIGEDLVIDGEAEYRAEGGKSLTLFITNDGLRAIGRNAEPMGRADSLVEEAGAGDASLEEDAQAAPPAPFQTPKEHFMGEDDGYGCEVEMVNDADIPDSGEDPDWEERAEQHHSHQKGGDPAMTDKTELTAATVEQDTIAILLTESVTERVHGLIVELLASEGVSAEAAYEAANRAIMAIHAPAPAGRVKKVREPKAASGKKNYEARPDGKINIMFELLRREEGATVSQMAIALNWVENSVRGAMSGMLKKKMGLDITSTKEPGAARIYHLSSIEAQPTEAEPKD